MCFFSTKSSEKRPQDVSDDYEMKAMCGQRLKRYNILRYFSVFAQHIQSQIIIIIFSYFVLHVSLIAITADVEYYRNNSKVMKPVNWI